MTDLAQRVRRAGQLPSLCALLDALGCEVPADSGEALGLLEQQLAGGPEDLLWLALAVLDGRLPQEADVLRARRRSRLDGPLAGLSDVLGHARWGRPAVRIVVDEVLVDLHHTAQTELATGIQRVARRTSRIWDRDHDLHLVGWTRRLDALRPLDQTERRRALHGGPGAPGGGDEVVLVPWRCRYVLPELLVEADRASRLQAMLRFSGTGGSMIGFDCTPVSSAETVAGGMAAGFTAMLSALAWGDRIAAISEAAAAEYAGWRSMLTGSGIAGPDILAVSLATEAAGADVDQLMAAGPAGTAAAAAVDRALDGLLGSDLLTDLDPGLPLVLCVGSHEPRKNHLAVIHAAEVLWDEGLRFALLFVGGNAWHSDEFVKEVRVAQGAGRPVETVTALPDAVLAAAYRRARFTVFPSWNEGFGLPVAESLAVGTPVLTSRWGSMAEIAEAGGALLVDPRQDPEIIAGLRQLLQDDDLYERLRAEAGAFETRTWDDYAAETWEYLVTTADDPATTGRGPS